MPISRHILDEARTTHDGGPVSAAGRHWLVKGAAGALLLVIVCVAAILLAWNAGLLRSSFIRFVSSHTGRTVEVRGALHLHLFTRSPWIEAEQVTLGNPAWTKPGTTADIAKISVRLAPLLSHESGLDILRIDSAQLHFTRDSAGHANWQRVDPDKSPGGPLPMIRALSLANTHLTLVDERLHLFYDGTLSVDGPPSALPLQIDGSGTLNERAVTFHLKGGALPSASPDKPYAFEFDERSSGAHVTAHGSLPRPFDLGMVDAKFEAGGADLRDLYHLVGVSLPNTGTFHLQGRMVRRGGKTLLDDLKVVSGESDVTGRISIDSQQGRRTRVRAELSSAVLRIADVGLRAAGRDPHPDAPPKLFSDVSLITPVTRGVDASGTYNVHRLVLSRVEVSDLSAPFTLERGHIEAPKISGHFMGGNLLLTVDTDANQTPARTRVEMTVTGLQLGRLPHKAGPPPFDGSMLLKIRAEGAGDSLHALAAAADGTFSARVSQGTMRASLAELTGVDLRGLGLALTGSNQTVAVRCAAADFDIHAGTMAARQLFIDSEPVFIGGEGRVLLDSEMLDLKVRGEPKRLRVLRIKAPLWVQGTLLRPTFRVDVVDSKLRLVDRGTPHEADCD